jgi:hypothetical protein
MSKRDEMTVDDFVFMSFMRGAKLIHKQLKDKRLIRHRYVADRRWMYDRDPERYKDSLNDVTCWFHVPYNTKRSIPLDKWVEDCEKMGLNWELRQADDKHYTVFLFLKDGWIYNKQIRDFATMDKQSEEYWQRRRSESENNI